MMTENPLEALVKNGALSNRSKTFEEIVQYVQDDEYPLDSPQAQQMMTNFPRFNEPEIAKKLTCGVYQLKLARNYVDQHMYEHGGFLFYIHKSCEDIIRARLQIPPH